MRPLRIYGVTAAVAIAIALTAWWVLSERGTEEKRRGTTIASDAERAPLDEGLWIEGQRALGNAEADAASGSVRRREAGGNDEAPAAAEAVSGFGVRARVVDGSGKPLSGWAVVLLREDPRWKELASSGSVCGPGQRMRNCGACHDRPAEILVTSLKLPKILSPWSPDALAEIEAAHDIAARAISAPITGEVFFPIDSADSAAHAVRLECTPDPSRAVAIQPSDPPPLVELVVAGEELVSMRVLDEETWHVVPTFLRPWGGDNRVWLRCGESAVALDAKHPLDLRMEKEAEVRFEAWIERAFAPRLHLEPLPSSRGRELALDVREHFARASVRVLDAAGAPVNGARLVAYLNEGSSQSEALLEADEDGRIRFALGTGVPAPRGRGLTVKQWPVSRFGIPVEPFRVPVEEGEPLRKPGHDEAQLDLSAPLSTGSEVDFGAIRFGTGPLLVAGRVIDQLGRPIPDAFVRLPERNELLPCDAAGRFERRGFSTTPTLILQPVAEAYAEAKSQRLTVPATDLTLVLQAASSLRLRLLAPPELLAMPITLFAEHLDAQRIDAPVASQGWQARVDAEGRVQIDRLPAEEMQFSLRNDFIGLHDFRRRLEPGENDLGILDLHELVRSLRFQLAEPPGENLSAVVRGKSASGTVFHGEVDFRSDGSLELWVPQACQIWTLERGKQRWSGTVDDLQPIRLN